MRLIFTVFLCFLITCDCVGQFNVNGDYKISGNVGIGTSSPENQEGWGKVLHVHHNDHAKFIFTTANEYSGMWVNNDHSSYSAPAGSIIGTRSNHPFSIITNGISRLSFTAAGSIKLNGIGIEDNLGIGINIPENSDGWGKVLNIHHTNNAKIIATTSNIYSGLWVNEFNAYGAPSGGIIGTKSNHPFSIITNGISRLTFTGAGNIKLNGIGIDDNLGIGTNTPENSDGWGKVLNIHNPNHAKIIATSANIYSGLWVHENGAYSAPSGGIIGTKSNHPFSIITNGISRLTFTSAGNLEIKDKIGINGNVGIGTNMPENQESWGKVLNVHNNSNAKIIATTNTIYSGFWVHEGGYYGAPGGGIIGTKSEHPFSIVTNGSAKVFVTPGGDVGIGSKNPDAKLAVNGKIHAKEIKVDLNVPGPDYVFEKDYNLQPLLAIEKYIKENKHLPEIPSAKEMEINGLELGEINMKLLQKIEELTLYLIEKDKQITELNKRVSKLEAK